VNEGGVIMPVPVVVIVVVLAKMLTTMMKHVGTQYYHITLFNLSV